MWRYVHDKFLEQYVQAVLDDLCGSVNLDSFDIILEKRLSGVAVLRYTMLYGRSRFKCVSQKVKEQWWPGNDPWSSHMTSQIQLPQE